MCCYASAKSTQEFLLKNRGKKFIYGYKKVDFDGELRPLHRYEYKIPKFTYKPGWNKSNCRSSTKTISKDRNIYRGIHVSLSKEWYYANCNTRIIKLRCYLDDLIGVDGCGDGVFKKVYLEKAEYERAIGKKVNE